MYRMHHVIRETLHMRACAHAHTGVSSIWRYIRYIRYIELFSLMRG